MTAVSDHIEPPVPPGRKTYLECNFRIQHARNSTECGNLVGGGYIHSCYLHYLIRLEATHSLTGLDRLDVRL